MCSPCLYRTPFYAVHLDVTNSFDSLAPRLVYTIIQKKIVCQVASYCHSEEYAMLIATRRTHYNILRLTITKYVW